MAENNACGEWVSVKEGLPPKDRYVLMRTYYCKYPADVGYYNGINWYSAEKTIQTMNVGYWAEIINDNLPETP